MTDTPNDRISSENQMSDASDQSLFDEPIKSPDNEKTNHQVDPRNKLNDLTAKEWMPETISVWVQRGLGSKHRDTKIEKQHPAPFSFTDVSRLIRFFTKKNDIVLDPFVGIGSTLKACALEGRRGIGIELNPQFVNLCRERLTTELNSLDENSELQQVIEGDVIKILPTLQDQSVDFVLTSPPYWSILRKKDHKANQERVANGLITDYGDDPRDLGNINSYEKFLATLSQVFNECHRILIKNKYMAIIVSDFRDASKYIMFHADLAKQLEALGLELKGLITLYQRHKKIFPYGYPYSFVPNIHNQFILILQKRK